MASRSSRLVNAGVLAASLLFTLLVMEAGFRVAFGLPLLALRDWRWERVVLNRLGERGDLDPLLGWTLKSNFKDDRHSTLDYGIRRNGEETTLRTGHILAVGDSFTEGWEVDDDDSWPAYLELKSGIPVINGGVGGYGTDQIILRIEQLLPIVKPHTLIIGFLQFDIYRTGHTHFGAPKPWFTTHGGELQYHPPAPVEAAVDRTLWSRLALAVRDDLANSVMADYLLARLAPNYWYGSGKPEYIKADNDPVQVTCLLLERLKKTLDQQKIRTLLFMQYYAPVVMMNDRPPEDARQVMACAERLGIEVVDHFASLKAIAMKDSGALRNYYMVYGDTFTHMNGEGNEHAADLLLSVLRRQ